jgi:hypothetical protein
MASITMGLGLLANLIGMPALLSTRRQVPTGNKGRAEL